MEHDSVYICVMVIFLFSNIENEHSFMDGDSQDDFISSVRNTSIRTYA